MRVRRRLTMQLTPLLDLLLIVIFAQFMDVQEREATTVDAAHEAVEQRHRAEYELGELQLRHLQTLEALNQTSARVSRLQSENGALAGRARQLQADVQRALAQQRLFGELVTELFGLPESVVSQVLTPAGAASPAASAEQREFLNARFRELSLQNAGRMIRHLLSYEEMRKRCDLWELHIDETGWFSLRAGKEKRGFRATTPEEFSDKLYSVYKSLPQPKSLVVIMLSYGDTRGEIRDAAERGLPVVSERMRRNTAGFIRFEYAILGYQPAPEG